MTKLTIRPFVTDDFPAWLPLWDGNNNNQRDADVTAQTWSRMTSDVSPVNGLGAWDGDTLAGLVHYILHPVTGHINDACYMQDLYVAPAFRKQGIARALLTELEKTGKSKRWARLYWLAEEDNEAAQKLYENIGLKLRFTFHVMPLS